MENSFSSAQLAARIAARQIELAGTARDLRAESRPSAIANRAKGRLRMAAIDADGRPKPAVVAAAAAVAGLVAVGLIGRIVRGRAARRAARRAA